MTTAQHPSFLSSPLNFKSPSKEAAGEHAAAPVSASKDDRDHDNEQVVPDHGEAPPTQSSPGPQAPSPPSAPKQRSESVPDLSAEEAEQKLQDLTDEISVEENGDVIVRVPAELVGRMIGKHGTVIKELQLQSGAFINMAKEGEVHRIARITGSAAEARLCACILVQKFTVAEQTEKHALLDALIAHYRKAANRPQKQYVVESFTLPSEALGRVIGKGGSTLRELQDRTHAKIDLPRSTGTDDARKVLTISGLAGEVASCRDMLRTLVAEHSDYDGGYFATAPYDSPHVVPSRTPYYPVAPPGYAPGSPYTMPHYVHASPAASHYIESPYGTPPYMMSYPSPPHAPTHAAYYPDQLGADLSRVSLESDDHVVPLEAMGSEMVLPIPGDMVGRLIGRHGVAVKQIQNESRTRIDVLDPSPHHSPMVRFVRITGPRPDAVQHCVALIQSRVAHFYSMGPGAPMSPASVHGGYPGHRDPAHA